MVFNISVNENEPIVNRPEEALDCFLRTEINVLVMRLFVIQKPGAPRCYKSSAEGADVADVG